MPDIHSKLTNTRYVPLVVFQILLFIIDFTINITIISIRKYHGLALGLYLFQIICLILAFSTIFLSFFATYVYQVGLLDLLHERFKYTLIICLLYFITTTGMDIWSIILRSQGYYNNWPIQFTMFLCFQRFMAPVYYYEFKRFFLRISDPRFYEDNEYDQS